MHSIVLIRDSAVFGPYDEAHVLSYYKEGKILLNDLVLVDGGREKMSFSAAAAHYGWTLPQPESPWAVIRRIGVDLLFPFKAIATDTCAKQVQVWLFVAVGLAPMAAAFLASTLAVYVALAIYVSMVWSVFFWMMFRTETSSVKKGVLCFGFTSLLSTTLLVVLLKTGWMSSLDLLVESESVLVRLFAFFFRAGLPEEICKAVVIFLLVRRPGAVLKPQDVVLYGLLSGFGFGVHEGLSYQLGINRMMNDVDATYVYNVLRLTSLPFLHACWCGISSYFIAHAAIAPMSRYGLWLLAILVPAGLHTIYDALEIGYLSLAVAAVSAVLMMAYLSAAKNLRRKLV